MTKFTNKFVLLYFAVVLLINGGLSIAISNIDRDINNLYINMIYATLIFAIPFFLYCLATKSNINSIPRNKIGWKNVLYIIGMTIVIQPFLNLVAFVSSYFSNNNVDAYISSIIEQPFIFIFIAVAVLPAIYEELMFRGVFFSAYAKELPIKKAAIMSGVLFGLFHFQLEQFFYAAIMGFIFCYFYHYTRSIYAPMISHFMINGVSISLAYFTSMAIAAAPPENVAAYTEAIAQVPDLMILGNLILSCLFSVPIFILLFLMFIKRNQKINLEIDLTTEAEIIPQLQRNDKLFDASLIFALVIGAVVTLVNSI